MAFERRLNTLFITLEGEVDTEIERCVRVERHKLLGELADGVVATEEEVETGGVDVEKPTETYSVSACHTVHIDRKEVDRGHVG